MMYAISNHNRWRKPFDVSVILNGVSMTMVVDTCASVSVVSDELFEELQEEGAMLCCMYTGESIDIAGTTDVTVEHDGHIATLPLIVTCGK